jgi:hypothetical protein
VSDAGPAPAAPRASSSPAQPLVRGAADNFPTERIPTNLPTIPVAVQGSERSGSYASPPGRSQASSAAALFHQASPSGVHAQPAAAQRTGVGPEPEKPSAMTWVWWTLGTLALAGAMIALIYFAKR